MRKDRAAGRRFRRSAADRCPPAQAQAHQQELVGLGAAQQVLRCETRPSPCRSTSASHASGRSSAASDSPAAHVEASMRARSDTGIFAVAPINEIVPALRAWLGTNFETS